MCASACYNNNNNNNNNNKFIIIIIVYLLKSTEQEDAHMINTRTRAGQERHRKLALTFCPLKRNKKNKHTRHKNNYDYAYRKNAEKSTQVAAVYLRHIA